MCLLAFFMILFLKLFQHGNKFSNLNIWMFSLSSVLPKNIVTVPFVQLPPDFYSSETLKEADRMPVTRTLIGGGEVCPFICSPRRVSFQIKFKLINLKRNLSGKILIYEYTPPLPRFKFYLLL